MKKKIGLLLLLAALLLSSGCGKEEIPETPEVPVLTLAPTQAAPETTAAPELPAATAETTVPIEETTVPATLETEAPTEAATVPVEAQAPTTSGKVIQVESVNVREGPSVNTKVVRKLHRNDPVVVTEGIVLDSVRWAHTEDGWICADYLELNDPIPAPRGKEGKGMPGVVYHTDSVNVREAPSQNAARAGELLRNDIVVIYETTESGGIRWGRMDLGWVSMEYVQLQQDNAVLNVTGGDWVPEHTPESDLHDFTAPSEGVYPGEDLFRP